MRPFVRAETVNADEHRVLKKTVVSGKLPVGKVRRVKIVLLSKWGHTAQEIAQKLDCSDRTALKWISRFNRFGVAGLEEDPRGGCPSVYGPEDVGAVIQAALTAPQEGGEGEGPVEDPKKGRDAEPADRQVAFSFTRDLLASPAGADRFAELFMVLYFAPNERSVSYAQGTPQLVVDSSAAEKVCLRLEGLGVLATVKNL